MGTKTNLKFSHHWAKSFFPISFKRALGLVPTCPISCFPPSPLKSSECLRASLLIQPFTPTPLISAHLFTSLTDPPTGPSGLVSPTSSLYPQLLLRSPSTSLTHTKSWLCPEDLHGLKGRSPPTFPQVREGLCAWLLTTTHFLLPEPQQSQRSILRIQQSILLLPSHC